MRRFWMGAALCAAFCAAAGCGERKEKGTEAAAVVNGEAIPCAEVHRLTDAFLKQFGAGVSAEQKASLKGAMGRQALQNLINQKMLVQEADRKGITADPKQVEAQMARVMQMFPDPAKMKEQLASMGATEEDLRRDVAQNLKIRALLDQQAAPGPAPTKKEIEDFYKENRESFDTPERVQASHILITVAPGDTQEQKAEKRARLEEIRKKIQKGADFAQCAKESSECPSKAQGGDLGYFEKGKMVPEFEKAAFSLKKGGLSPIVETQFGYHLIKVTDRKAPEKGSLDNATERISAYLVQQKKQKAIRDYIEKLRASAQISYPSEEYRPQPEPPAAEGAVPPAPAPAPRTVKLAPGGAEPEAKAGSPAGK